MRQRRSIRWLPTCLLLAAAGAAAVLAPARGADSGPASAGADYVRADAPEILSVLPAPPEPGSLPAEADLLSVRLAQYWRTPEQVEWARYAEKGDPFSFAQVLGAWFTPANAPVTAAFLRALNREAEVGIDVEKRHFARRRPFLLDPSLKPCVKAPQSGSYPSGHAVNFYLQALVLGDVAPEKRAALLGLAERLAWGRVIGGVHFPSDLAAGRTMAEAIVAAARRNASYRDAVAASASELAFLAAHQ